MSPATEADAALSILRDEHRRLAAVVRALEYLARDATHREIDPDRKLLTLILDFIEAFPNRFHHPKEDEYLFTALRRRTSAANAVLDELEAEHGSEARLVNELQRLLAPHGRGRAAQREAFAAAVARYGDHHREHARKEEEIVMPLAERMLRAADWRPILGAFQAEESRRAGEEFRKLLSLIVRLAAPAVVRLLTAVERC